MATLKDSASREWEISLNNPQAIPAIRCECDPGFLRGEPVETLQLLENDPFLVCQIVTILCREQLAQQNVSETVFYEGITGDTFEATKVALMEAILAFLPFTKRETLKAAIFKAEQMNTIGMKLMMEFVNDPELESKLITKFQAKADAFLA